MTGAHWRRGPWGSKLKNMNQMDLIWKSLNHKFEESCGTDYHPQFFHAILPSPCRDIARGEGGVTGLAGWRDGPFFAAGWRDQRFISAGWRDSSCWRDAILAIYFGGMAGSVFIFGGMAGSEIIAGSDISHFLARLSKSALIRLTETTRYNVVVANSHCLMGLYVFCPSVRNTFYKLVKFIFHRHTYHAINFK